MSRKIISFSENEKKHFVRLYYKNEDGEKKDCYIMFRRDVGKMNKNLVSLKTKQKISESAEEQYCIDLDEPDEDKMRENIKNVLSTMKRKDKPLFFVLMAILFLIQPLTFLLQVISYSFAPKKFLKANFFVSCFRVFVWFCVYSLIF